ncbi:MAG: BamA/OMP85 family outer membrane protein [Ignavibacteria bacterium]
MKYFIALILLLFCGTLHPQIYVNDITFIGNSYFSTFELQTSMVTQKGQPFNNKQFELDLKNIRSKYKDFGFYNIRITNYQIIPNEDTSTVNLRIFLVEGVRSSIGKINLIGNKILKTNEILSLMTTRVGDYLNGSILLSDVNAILDHYEKQNMPFTKVSIDDISLYEQEGIPKVNLSIKIQEEATVKVEQITIKGNEVTNEKVILRELKLGRDKLVSREILDAWQKRLERLNIFETVEKPRIYLNKTTGKAGLLIEVKEGNLNTFDGILGYSPPLNNEEKGYFTGIVNVMFKNVFGTGRNVELKWQKPDRSSQELEFKYFEPYLLGLPINLAGAFLQRIQDSTYTRRKVDTKFDFPFSDKITLGVSFGYDRVLPSDDTTSQFSVSDSRIISSGIELRYDSRNSVYYPTGGILYKLYYSYGDKKILSLRNQLLSSDVNQSFSIQRYSMELESYFSFFRKQSLLLRFVVQEVKSDKLENADYFRIGGNKNIRGYREEQFLASRLAYGNTEFRYSISRRGFLFALFDYGYYYRQSDEVLNIPKQEGFLYGYGVGLRVETAIGLVGVSYSLGKGDGPIEGKINFGLINEF